MPAVSHVKSCLLLLTAGDVLGTVLVMIGKFAITGSFAITYNYTAELFPTVVRSSAVGVGTMGARISGVMTPLVTLLVTATFWYR